MVENTKSILEKYIDSEKVIRYLKNQQNEDGSYPSSKSYQLTTFYCLGILHELNAKPKCKSTINYVLSLQTGFRGFGESVGQNSWSESTYIGSEMHKFLNITPRYKKEFIKFVQSHQNNDGGFGENGEPYSNLRSTIYWVLSLLNIKADINNSKKLESYLNCHLANFKNLNIFYLYHIVEILDKLNLENLHKNELISFINKYSEIDVSTKNLEEIFYWIALFRYFNIVPKNMLNIKEKIIAKYNNGNWGDPKTTFFAVKILKMLDSLFEKEKILNYVYSLELAHGGFFDKRMTNILTAYECIQGLRLLGSKPKFIENIKQWIGLCKNEDGGFSLSPGNSSNVKATFWAIRCLKMLESTPIYSNSIINYLSKNVTKGDPFNTYYIIYTCTLLDWLPKNYQKIVFDLLRYKNEDGGFSARIGGFSQMYDTMRVIVTIYNISRMLDKMKIEHPYWLMKIKDDVVKWVLRCENEDGGFSWVPNDMPYLQPTYQALHILWILDSKPNNVERHVNYILNCQNPDGGFNGGEKNTMSLPLYTYYALASLLILGSMEKNKKIELDCYLGL